MEVKRPDTPRPMEIEPEICPSCHEYGTYISHASKGLRTCNGCEDNICTKCRYGCRYYCPAVSLPAPSSPASRQCSTEKWQLAEEYLRQHPELTQTFADIVTERHFYIVRRTLTGEFVRVHQYLKVVEQK